MASFMLSGMGTSTSRVKVQCALPIAPQREHTACQVQKRQQRQGSRLGRSHVLHGPGVQRAHVGHDDGRRRVVREQLQADKLWREARKAEG